MIGKKAEGKNAVDYNNMPTEHINIGVMGIEPNIESIKGEEMRRDDAEASSHVENDGLEPGEMTIYKVELSDITVIYTNHNRIIKRTYKKINGDKIPTNKIVYIGNFKPIRRLDVDGTRYFEVDLQEKVNGNMNDILNFMRRQGGVVSSGDLSNCVNALITSIDMPVEIGHATYGIYLDDDVLELCLDPHPVSDEQRRICRQVKEAVNQKLTKESIQAYVDVLSFWHQYEVYPVMSYGVMAPFGYVLKKRINMLIPYLYHSSPMAGLGKTITGRIFSQKLYGVAPESMSAFCSDFRMADTLNSFCGLKCLDEAEQYPWGGKVGEKIKQAAENHMQDKRGTSSGKSRLYYSRLIACFTGNGFPIKTKSELVRFLRIEFDILMKDQRSNREKSRELNKLIESMRPLGFRIVESELQDLNYSIDELIRRIERYADEIVASYDGAFFDQRRPAAFGLIYEGLKVWERLCIAYGVEWLAPSIKEFVDCVVKPIEESTFELKELPVDDFLDWFELFKIMDKERCKGTTWKPHTLKLEYQDYDGIVITNPILKQYIKTNKSGNIKNMGDLARWISSLSGLSMDDIYKKRRFKLNGRTKNGVFIADCILSDTKTDGNSVTNPDVTEESHSYHSPKIDGNHGNQVQQKVNSKSYGVTSFSRRENQIHRDKKIDRKTASEQSQNTTPDDTDTSAKKPGRNIDDYFSDDPQPSLDDADAHVMEPEENADGQSSDDPQSESDDDASAKKHEEITVDGFCDKIRGPGTEIKKIDSNYFSIQRNDIPLNYVKKNRNGGITVEYLNGREWHSKNIQNQDQLNAAIKKTKDVLSMPSQEQKNMAIPDDFLDECISYLGQNEPLLVMKKEAGKNKHNVLLWGKNIATILQRKDGKLHIKWIENSDLEMKGAIFNGKKDLPRIKHLFKEFVDIRTKRIDVTRFELSTQEVKNESEDINKKENIEKEAVITPPGKQKQEEIDFF